MLTQGYDPLQVVGEAMRCGVPPFLQAPGQGPVLPGLKVLDIAFDGGPVTALKLAEDGERLVLRLWNVLERPVGGTARLPVGFARAERCDALERPLDGLPGEGGRIEFTVPARGFLTVAFAK